MHVDFTALYWIFINCNFSMWLTGMIYSYSILFPDARYGVCDEFSNIFFCWFLIWQRYVWSWPHDTGNTFGQQVEFTCTGILQIEDTEWSVAVYIACRLNRRVCRRSTRWILKFIWIISAIHIQVRTCWLSITEANWLVIFEDFIAAYPESQK
jgi:hypothetical protein